jgi:hypothetical protein
MALNIRGGTHVEFAYIANDALGATLRGMDMAAWYTQAWFDRYLKRDPGADARLLTNRWLNDPGEAAVDPNHDGNLLSTYYLSRVEYHQLGGNRVICEDLRSGPCAGLLRPDGLPPNYSYLQQALGPDSPGPGSGGGNGSPATQPGPCPRVVRLHLRARWHAVRVVLRVNGRRIRTARGRPVRAVAVPLPASGDATVRLRLSTRQGRRRAVVLHYRGCALVPKPTRHRRRHAIATGTTLPPKSPLTANPPAVHRQPGRSNF